MYWVDKWEEATDPQKYVYEDVGIAAFLIAMWETERTQLIKQFPDKYNDDYRQTFVDLGCGNGFLVYLLESEGYHGYGIDILKRKIWDKFPPNVRNIEEPIHPETAKYEGVDWILANHSDELTPWIPFIASRTNSRFWVLPCCEWTFDRRFTIKRKNLSRYLTYLEYVKEITAACGYKVEVEPMRIPSTRNVSIVGRTRTIDVNNPDDLETIRKNQEELLKKQRFTSFQPRARDQKSHDAQCSACHESHESHEAEEDSEASEAAQDGESEPSSKRQKIE
jgi:tRNASer (uridine44-2'-O)-methyltransferase